MLQRTLPLSQPVDLASLFGVARGPLDPTCRLAGTTLWRATRSLGGPATLQADLLADRVEATAWGDGAEAVLDGLPELLGLTDDVSGFEPRHDVVAKLWRDRPGLRLPRTRGVSEALIAVVLEQRVTTFEAHRSQRQLVERWGEPAPGPAGLLLPVDPEVLAGIAYYELHVIGIEKARADTIRRVAAQARSLDALIELDASAARARIEQIPGVGRWSSAETALIALGDADAVPVGDLHLPGDVTYALTGEAVHDDDAMLAALEPYQGHRGRVVRLLLAAGVHAPRRAPRYAPRDIRQA